MHLELKQVEALAAVLRTGSFDTAAEQLCLTPSALSQRVRLLEERVGAVLIVRGSPCMPTEEGRRVWRYAQDVALREHELVASLALDIGQSHVPVALAITPDTMATWFLEALREVPDLLYSLKVDNAEEGTRLLARGDVLAAVTFGARQVQGCDSFPLGALRYMPVCSPGFFAQWFADGLTAEAFQRAPCVTYNEQDRLQIRFASAASGQAVVPPSHYMTDARALADAAVFGMGWVMLPHLLARPLLEDGQLVLMSEDHHIDSALVWQVARASQGVMRPLTRSVRRTARRLLLQ